MLSQKSALVTKVEIEGTQFLQGDQRRVHRQGQLDGQFGRDDGRDDESALEEEFELAATLVRACCKYRYVEILIEEHILVTSSSPSSLLEMYFSSGAHTFHNDQFY